MTTTIDTTDLTTEALGASESNVLISLRATLDEERKNLSDAIGRIDMVLTRRMEQDEATAILNPDFDVRLLPKSVQYDQNMLRQVLEYISEWELEDAGAYIPEHEETVPAKWNVTKLKPFSKFNRAIGDIIERAKLEGPAVIKVKAKKRATS